MYCKNCGVEISGNENFCANCGTAIDRDEKTEATETVETVSNGVRETANAEAVETVAAVAKTEKKLLTDGEGKFTGGAFANYFIDVITVIATVCTLGLLYPVMACWKMKWKAKHTYRNGNRLTFDGTAMQLFGQYIKWLLLSIITFGVYLTFAMPLNVKRWQTKHTHFEGVRGESKFDGTIWGLFGVNFVAGLVTLITFGIGSYWAHCYKERWYAKHEVIDGCRMRFDGTGMQYFGKCIVWVLLTVVTLGIYSFWMIVKQENWTASHKVVDNVAELSALTVMEKDPETEKPKSVNKVALMGLIFSIVGCFSYFMTIPGIICSIIGLKVAKANNGDRKGVAMAGLIIGAVYIASAIFTGLFAFVMSGM